MSYQFTVEEQSQLRSAMDACSGLTWNASSGAYEEVGVTGTNCVPLYQTLSSLINQKLNSLNSLDESTIADLKSAKLWLDVAIGANSGIGMHSAFIRAYTNRQGELRLGRSFSEDEMQDASNVVARNVANGLLYGELQNGLAPWTVPRIDQIAGLDAKAIGEALFREPLGSDDTATSRNAGWSGAIGFNLLGGVSPFETWRLISAGDPGSEEPGNHSEAKVNTLDDFKNILFAVDSYQVAFQAGRNSGVASSVDEFIRFFSDDEEWIGAYRAQFNIGWESEVWLGLISDVVEGTPISPVVSLIESLGISRFFDVLKGVYAGSFENSTTEENFTARAFSFFSGFTASESQSLKVNLITDYGSANDWVNIAIQSTEDSLAMRNALKYLSPMLLYRSDGFTGRGLELSTPSNGNGSLTQEWLTDRATMLSYLVKQWSTGDNFANSSTFVDLSVENKVNYEDLGSGIDITVVNYDYPAYNYPARKVVFGSDQGEEISGGITHDRLYGSGGDDTLHGDAGNDYLEGGIGNDVLDGSKGNDTLLGMSDNDQLNGGAGDDYMLGGSGNDTLDGGSGNDIMSGELGQDIYVIDGSSGHDTIDDPNSDGGVIKFQGHVLSGGKATSTGAQEWKDDYVTYRLVNENGTQSLVITVGASTVTVLNWQPGRFGINLEEAEVIPPIETDLVIEGDKKPIDFDLSQEGIQTQTDDLGNVKTDPEQADSGRDDRLYDGIGNDELYGYGGDDILDAYRGGDNLLDGGDGIDWIVAESGSDTLIGGNGSDRLFGGAGDDRLYADEQIADEQIFVVNEVDNGAAERGSLLSGEYDNDFLIGGVSLDLLLGGTGKDTLLGGAGDDVLYGDSFVSWSSRDWNFTRRVEFDAVENVTEYWVDFVGMGTVVLGETGQEGDFLYGGAGNDWLLGQNGQDYLDGSIGNDVLFGGRDSDFLQGGTGDDVITGDAGITPTGLDGDDYLAGGSGNDSLIGDGGNDILLGGDDDDVLSGDNGKIDAVLHGDDFLDGGNGSDRLYGNGGDDRLFGGEGNDNLVGDGFDTSLPGVAHGRDVLNGGQGNDTLFGTGGDDELYGGDDDDRLLGDAAVSQLAGQYHGNDLLDAGDGNDILHGGGGRDTLYGGNGNDQLVGDDSALALEFHGDDRIYGGAGNDLQYGGGGDDVIDGGADHDQLIGEEGQDSLIGGSGDDGLWGQAGNDRIDGGSGYDYFEGGAGDDTYAFTLGDSHLSALGYTEFITDDEGSNTLEFGAGISVDDIQLTQYPDLLQLRYSAQDSLLIMGGLASGVDQVKFADNSSYSLASLYARNSQDVVNTTSTEANVSLVGSAVSNQLTATGGGATFRGGRGDDTLVGSAGGNLYLYERGDGVDHIYDTTDLTQPEGTLAPNRVRFGEGIRPQDIKIAPAAGGTLEVLIAGEPSGKLVIHNFDANNAANSCAIDSFEFADGTALSYAYLLGTGFNLLGGTGNDSLLGSNLSDVLQGNAGNDQLTGGAGADLYLYASGHGSDTIVESNDGSTNTLRFAVGLSPADIELGADAAQNLLLKVKSSGDTLVLANWLATGAALVQRIEFADGTVWTPEWIRQNLKVQSGTAGNDVLSALAGQATTLYGLAGSDTLNGSTGDDQLVGGTGNDSLAGGAGNDSYLIELGDGQDIVQDAGGLDSLVYATGITANYIQVSRINTDLVLSHINGSDKLTLKDWFLYSDRRAWVEEIRFADGTVLEGGVLTSQLLTQIGTSGNDYLRGIEIFGDTLRGGDGNDYLVGYSGNDSLEGGAGYDTLVGGEGNDSLAVGAGGGYASGDAGDDLYLYQGGEGNLEIYDFYGQDTLRLGEGIEVADLQFKRNGDTLLITLIDGQQIKVSSWFSSTDGSRMIDRFEFADGTTITAAEINQIALLVEGTAGSDQLNGSYFRDTLVGAGGDDYLNGSDGDDLLRGDQGRDSLYGSWGNDRLEGGAESDQLFGEDGNDQLHGGDGNDILDGSYGDDSYLDLGQGQDRILDNEGLDSLYFDGSINPANVIISRNNSDLLINFFGRNDSVILLDWFGAAQNSIERFVFADGSQWGVNEVSNNFNLIAGNGSVSGSAGDDLLYGGAGQDTLHGGAGNDFLDGGTGTDTLIGDIGNDTYVSDGADLIVEQAGGGIDTLVWRSSNTVVLQNELENVVLTAKAAWGGVTGNQANNYIVGNDFGNSIDGGVGSDTMEGGLGNDSYVVDSIGDVIIERESEGTEYITSNITYSLGQHLENLTLSGDVAINGFGNELNNYLSGNGANNLLVGGAGADSLSGRLGSDTLSGGEGNDSYYLNDWDDTVIDDGGGQDSIYVFAIDKDYGGTWYVASYTMPETIERFVMGNYVTHAKVYGNNQNNYVDTQDAVVFSHRVGNITYYYRAEVELYGGAGDDFLRSADGDSILDGGAGNDTMTGGLGSDRYYVDSLLDQVIESPYSNSNYDEVYSTISYSLSFNIENLKLLGSANLNGTGNDLGNILTGNSGNNLLVGGAGNDRLISGGGFDTLIGGAGNDSYVLSSSGVVFTELAGEGEDTIETGLSHTLASNFEKLILTGALAIDGTGNDQDNWISGNDANNRLVGGLGNDTLSGAGGNDSLLGGLGDDLYYVNSSTDVVTELANEGIDTVSAYSTYTLGNNIENLTLDYYGGAINGTGNTLNNQLTGNDNNNSLSGAAGNDTLAGNGGTDTLIGGLENDTYLLKRGDGTDTITENDATAGNTDIALFMQGVTADQLWFRSVGSGKNKSLEVSIIGTSDKLVIDKWYAGSQYRVEEFKTTDGNKTLLESRVQNLVDAMASFAPPASGQTTLPENYQTALASVIAANWQ